jgi:hypothetical protein
MRLVRIPSFRLRAAGRRRTQLAVATCFIGLGGAVSSVVPAEAVAAQQGLISISGLGPVGPYPCANSCDLTFHAESTGDVSGVDASDRPFVLTWVAPAPSDMYIDLTLVEPGCPLLLPDVTTVTGSFTLTNAVLTYAGLPSMTTQVQGSFSTQPTGDAYVVNGLQLTATTATGTLNLWFQVANGLLVLTPTSTNLCQPPQMAASGTLLSAL